MVSSPNPTRKRCFSGILIELKITVKNMSIKPSSPWARFWGESGGLSVIIVCSLLMVPLALFTAGALRLIFSLALILFFPGYVLIAAVFPAQGRLDGTERLSLSFGLSLAVVPLLGLVLKFTPWGVTFVPILLSILIFVLVMSSVALSRRAKLLPEERFAVNFAAPFASLRAGWAGRKSRDRVLTVVLLAVIVATVGATVYVIQTPGASERFTEFYLLGPGGKAADYPRQIVLGAATQVIAGVVNHEGESVTYRLEIDMNGQPVGQVGNITLAKEGKWEEPVSFNATIVGDNQSVQFLLFRDANATAYRNLQLWIDVMAH
jgi:uncharacterized membrane protein